MIPIRHLQKSAYAIKCLFMLTIISALSIIAFSCSPKLQKGSAPDTLPAIFEGEIRPGEYIAFKWEKNKISEWEMPENNLTEKAIRAIAITPKWLRPDLAAKLDCLPSEKQDVLAEIILSTADPRFIDEISFCMAHLPDKELTGKHFDPQILGINAQLIYEADSLLDYVKLIDRGKPTPGGDWTTTARYRLCGGEGTEEYYELPYEVYYRYIVLPKIGRETLAFFDPVAGKFTSPDSGGVFWRDYLIHEDDNPKRCASAHFIMEYPNLITSVPAFAEPTELILTNFKIDPIPLIINSNKEPLLCAFAWPGGQFDGQIIATTIPVELDSVAHKTGLLENMLRAGNASAMLDTAIIPDEFDDIRIAILKDHDPFGQATIEHILDSISFQFQVFDSDNISKMLTAEPGFIKIIIPSGQPRLFYEKLIASDSLWRAWMKIKSCSSNRVVEFHGAVDPNYPEDNWNDLRMPWEFNCSQRINDKLFVSGYPQLMDVLSNARFLWNNRPLTLRGRRAISENACALDLIGYFVTQNQPDRCAEVPFYYRGPDIDTAFEGSAAEYVQSLRSHYPQRSLYVHFGNCGEVMDILSASCRAALVPVRNVVANPIDHVWNDVYLQGKWRAFTVYRSDGSTRFDDGAYSGDNHFGAMGCRSDGYITNAIGDYFDSTFIAEVKVTDLNGLPVDGATVTIKTHWNKGEPPPKIHAGVGWTDLSGIAHIELGIKRDYFVQIYTPIEDWPELVPDTSKHARNDTIPKSDPVAERRRGMKSEPALLISETDFETTGDTIRYDVSMHFELPKVLSTTDTTADFSANEGSRLYLKTSAYILHGFSSYFRCGFTQKEHQGSVDIYVMDISNYDRFVKGKSFAVAYIFKNAKSIDLSLPATDDELFIVVSNRNRIACGQIVRLAVEYE